MILSWGGYSSDFIAIRISNNLYARTAAKKNFTLKEADFAKTIS